MCFAYSKYCLIILYISYTMSGRYELNSFEEEGRTVISTVVAVDKDKNSQYAVRWAIDNLKFKDDKIIIVHVSQNARDVPREGREPTESELKQLFLPFRSFCARKGIRVKEVVLQGTDIASTLSEYIIANSVATIVLGASNRGAIARAFKSIDVPTGLGNSAPDSCSVFVVSKGKTVKIKSSIESPTPSSEYSSKPKGTFSNESLANTFGQESWKSTASHQSSSDGTGNQLRGRTESTKSSSTVHSGSEYVSNESITYGSSYNSNPNSGPGEVIEYGSMTPPRQPCKNKVSPKIHQPMNNLNTVRVHAKESSFNSASGSSDFSGMMSFPSDVSLEILDQQTHISNSSRSSMSSLAADLEEDLRRLKQEFKHLTETYLGASQETGQLRDIVPWTLEEADQAQESSMDILEREKQRCKAAVEAAHIAQRIAELETEKRKRAEIRFKYEAEEKQKAIDALAHNEVWYRRYTIGEIEVATDHYSDSLKIGEGGYGPVFQAVLDHTPVAIKVVRPDITQGEKQFQREVEVLSRMRHPHMVLLLGACPESGCLVYEFMENGSLEDRLYRRNNTPTLSWRNRFRIAAEIGTALNFLHRTRPEPLVHRDLKPANILLDKNYVSKISDVGLSRLIPSTLADNFTQYCMTAAAGTFCYIDPEYQQTGMLGTKSDIYSLGVILLQLITSKPAMGLTHCVESAIEDGVFEDVLDPTVTDWPVEDALRLAKLGLKCCELRRKDRPDLDSVILPELERLRDLRCDQVHKNILNFRGNTSSSQVSNYYNSKFAAD